MYSHGSHLLKKPVFKMRRFTQIPFCLVPFCQQVNGNIDIPHTMDRKNISAPSYIRVTQLMVATQPAELVECSSRLVRCSTYKDVLRYIFDSEECHIDSKESQSLRKVVEELCTTENEELITYFEMMDNVEEIKQNKPKVLFKEMYKYS